MAPLGLVVPTVLAVFRASMETKVHKVLMVFVVSRDLKVRKVFSVHRALTALKGFGGHRASTALGERKDTKDWQVHRAWQVRRAMLGSEARKDLTDYAALRVLVAHKVSLESKDWVAFVACKVSMALFMERKEHKAFQAHKVRGSKVHKVRRWTAQCLFLAQIRVSVEETSWVKGRQVQDLPETAS